VRLELILQLEHVAEQVVLDGELGSPVALARKAPCSFVYRVRFTTAFAWPGLSFLARATV